ncbi:Suf-domain-containing protein [Hortaea werneckii]|nr:Suf-domain-containing protein [Hortaea werneckii]
MAEYDPSGLPDMSVDVSEQPEQQQQQQSDSNVQDAGDEEDDDYDPTSFNFGGDGANDAPMAEAPQQPAHPEGAAAPAEQTSKPRTVGGFIVEESDDEEEHQNQNQNNSSINADVPPPSQLNGTAGAQSGLGAAAVSDAAQQMAETQDVSTLASEPTQDSAAAQNAQAQAQAQASLNGSTAATPTPLPASTSVDPSSASAFTAPAASLPVAQGAQDHVSPAAAGTHGTTSVSATPKPSVNGVTAPSDHAPTPQVPTSSARLPHDKVGRLEDRIKEDPKADTAAWLELVQHYREKDQIDNVRRTYDRMLEYFPTAPSLWTAYVGLEVSVFDRSRIDALFSRGLPTVPNVELWTMYLDYLRRIFPLIPDPSGQSRAIITQGFEAVLDAVGIDPDSGNLWREYVDFVKSGPGVIGGQGWQDQQKSDLVRKAYQRAVKVPMAQDILSKLWKEYDQFESANSSNKAQGRKNVQEMGPHYMSARSARHNFDKFFEGLDRKSLPMLPPVHGYEGEDQFGDQVEKWKTWIDWETSDPVSLREDETPLYRKRVLYAFKQAVASLRFYPQIWFDAAQWCYDTAAVTPEVSVQEELATQGDDFLEQGSDASPESVLLCLKRADKMETSKLDLGSSDAQTVQSNGEKLDVPFEHCHKALYTLKDTFIQREKDGIAAIRERFASLPPEEEPEPAEQADDDDDDDESPATEKPKSRQEQMAAQIKSLQKISRARLEDLKKTISYVWVAKMRAFRRVQGQGNINTKIPKGFRGVFAEARPRGQLTSEVYVASALTEWFCHEDQSAMKIFERGLKLFPTDEAYAEAYVRFLVEQKHDLVNARVVFETTITKIVGPQQGAAMMTNTNAKETKDQEEEELKKKVRVRGLLWYMHDYESKYGDLAQIQKLEKRMRELYPDEPEVSRFASRFAEPQFDGMTVQLVLSESQVRPRTTPLPTVVQQPPPAGAPPMIPGLPPVGMASPDQGGLRLGPQGPYMASPKRPLDDMDSDAEHQRKFARAESPLKGAAGRRGAGGNQPAVLGSLAQGPAVSGGSGFITKNYVPPGAPQSAQQLIQHGPAPLPRDINFLLSILPHAGTYTKAFFDPRKMIDLLRNVNLEPARMKYGGGTAVGTGMLGGGGAQMAPPPSSSSSSGYPGR